MTLHSKHDSPVTLHRPEIREPRGKRHPARLSRIVPLFAGRSEPELKQMEAIHAHDKQH